MQHLQIYKLITVLLSISGKAILLANILMFNNIVLADKIDEIKKIETNISQNRNIEKKLHQKSIILAKELKTLRKQIIQLANNTQEREAIMTSLEQQLVVLTNDLKQRRTKLLQRNRELSNILSALSRISNAPSKAFFMYPGSPVDAIRSTMLLQIAVPSLRERADILRDELIILSQVKDDIYQKHQQLNQAENGLNNQRIKLAKILTKKTALHKQTEEQRKKTQKTVLQLVKKANTFHELLNNLNKRPPKIKNKKYDEATKTKVKIAKINKKPLGMRPFPDNGNIAAPAKGKLLQFYGQDTGFGQTSKGLMIQTRTGAQIIAPFDGQIVFAGPFRNHGLILIIEHDGGFHSVLAGFSNVNVVMGQWLLTGEPVGTMALIAKNNKPELYVELRRKGQPVNPLKWIKADSIKARG